MTFPRAGRILVIVALVALIVFPLISDNLYFQNMLILTFMLAIGATSWNVMGGYAGYISLGSGAFIGLGAYTTGILANSFGISPFIGCFAGGVVAALASAALSLATRRTRGMYFVIVTFAALELLGLMARNLSGLTGGSAGLAMPLPTWDLSRQNWPFYYALLGVMAAAVATSALVRRSKLGMGLFGIQDDEDKTAGLGVSTGMYKLLAFVVGSVFLGIAGGIYGYYLSYLDPAAMFDIVTSVLMVLAALIGGRGTVWGPVLGAFLLEPIAEFTNTGIGGANSGAIRLIMFGSILGAAVLFLPRGIIPTVRRKWPNLGRPAPAARDLGNPANPNEWKPEPTAAVAAGNHSSDILTTKGLTKSFGGIRAVSDMSIALNAGQITGLIGPNGSGKTTLFNLLDGTIPPSAGEVALEGVRVDRLSRTRRAHAGIGRTYQLPRLFASLTVVENIVFPERAFVPGRLLRRRVLSDERARTLALLEHLGLSDYADASPADLSYGQRKLVELAQALSLNPVLVLLDEPAAGISPALTRRLVGLVAELNAAGTSFLLVEHDLVFVGELCDRVYVMAAGALISVGTVEEVSADPLVVDAYLGDDLSVSAHVEVSS